MGAVLHDAPLGQHDDAVETRHRGQAVGHHDGGAAFHEPAQSLLHGGLALRVQSARGLVQHEDGAIGEHRPGDGDTLALTARQLDAALTGDGVEPLGQILDELERVGRPGRLANLLYRGVGPPIGDVLGNGAVEQQRLLGHIGDLPAQRLLGHVGHVLAVHQNLTLLDVGQAQQQLRERGLPRPAHAHEPHALPGGNLQVEIAEHLGLHIAVGVPEVDVLEVDVAQFHIERLRAGLVGHQARLIEHRRHAARVAEGLVDTLQARVDEVELVRYRVRVGEHKDDRARRDAEPGVATGDEHRHHGHDDHGDGRRGDATGERGPHALRIARHHLAIRRVEQPPLVVLAPVGLHGQDVRDRIR